VWHLVHVSALAYFRGVSSRFLDSYTYEKKLKKKKKLAKKREILESS
jgi:hypothetical protein